MERNMTEFEFDIHYMNMFLYGDPWYKPKRVVQTTCTVKKRMFTTEEIGIFRKDIASAISIPEKYLGN
jgi:hypothetical protein